MRYLLQIATVHGDNNCLQFVDQNKKLCQKYLAKTGKSLQ